MTRRRLSVEERTLWTDVTRSVAPLPKRRSAEPDDDGPDVALPAKPAAKRASKTKSIPAPVVAPPAVPRPVQRQEPAPLGRKARRRLARGAEAIDGRLDLHGLTQAQAHDALLGFLRAARGRGAKVVLVITGKGGGDAHEGRGVLKRQVPMWMRLPEFRELIVGFEDAAIAHGGSGAMYVRVRRTRE